MVVPTTLLARQHFKTFSTRFAGLPVKVGQASRLVGAKELAAVKAGIADGTIDIVIGTHALLGKAIKFRDLGLLIVDEEQHFGVKHKERLKELQGRRPCADAVGDADPAHAAAGADRRARAVADHHAADRPAGGPHLHLALRRAGRARGAAARALSRRPELLRLPADQRSRRAARLPRRDRAGGEGRGRPRPDAADRARGHHERLLRRRLRRAALDLDRRIRPRHPDRQHAHRPPRRHVRPRPALPAARPRRPLQAARLCAVHRAGGTHR